MKTNKYVYIVPLDDKYFVIFNGVNKKFIIVENKFLDSYVLIIRNPDNHISTHPNFIKKLLKEGFVNDKDFNEHEFLRFNRGQYINALEYKTSIIPTFECNYNCWYCIQRHEPIKLSDEKKKLIIRHIKRYLIENKIESYVLSWFGGEPLTQPHIIDHITKELYNFCQSNNIEFSAAVTTNGALLSDGIISMLYKNNVNYYQIAIDGDMVEHNKVKYDNKNPSSFTLILNNIVNLLNTNSEAHITLRINYTKKTLQSRRLVSDINSIIPENLRYRLTVDLQKIWQIKEESINLENLKAIMRDFSSSGYFLSTKHIFSMCYVEKIHYNMIYYNGKVEKCDKRSMDKLRGYINEDGNIIWREKPIFHDFDLFAKECACNECSFYPLCYCGCPVLREERILENGKVICGHNQDFRIFEQRIQDYCWRTIYNEKIQLS